MLCKLLGDLLRLSSSGFREQIQIDFETFLLPSLLPNLVSTLDIFLTLISKHLFLFGKQFFSPPKKREVSLTEWKHRVFSAFKVEHRSAEWWSLEHRAKIFEHAGATA